MTKIDATRTWLTAALAAALALPLAAGIGGCPRVVPGDDDTADDDDDDSLDPESIYGVQQGAVEEGAYVVLEDVIVTTPVGPGGFFVQEPDGGAYSGLYVYSYEDVLAVISPEIGDVVTVGGTVTEYYGMTELTLSDGDDLEITGSGEAPEPEVLSSADLAADVAEPWESVLIQTTGTVTAPVDEYGAWELDSTVLVDDMFYGVEPGVGAAVHRLVGVLEFSYDYFRIQPRFADDVDIEGAGPTTSTIYEIQGGSVAEGSYVTVTDVVVTSPSDGGGFYVQEAGGGEYSGIYAYCYEEVLQGYDPQPGDVLTLSGTYSEYWDLSELTITQAADLVLTDTGPEPAAEVLDTSALDASSAEPWEGVLVETAGTVTAEADEYGAWELDSTVLVDDDFYHAEPALDTVFSQVIGPLTYSYDAYRLLPRSAADLVE